MFPGSNSREKFRQCGVGDVVYICTSLQVAGHSHLSSNIFFLDAPTAKDRLDRYLRHVHRQLSLICRNIIFLVSLELNNKGSDNIYFVFKQIKYLPVFCLVTKDDQITMGVSVFGSCTQEYQLFLLLRLFLYPITLLCMLYLPVFLTPKIR